MGKRARRRERTLTKAQYTRRYAAAFNKAVREHDAKHANKTYTSRLIYR